MLSYTVLLTQGDSVKLYCTTQHRVIVLSYTVLLTQGDSVKLYCTTHTG